MGLVAADPACVPFKGAPAKRWRGGRVRFLV